MDSDQPDAPSDPAQGRRAFLKRMAALSFAAPVIASFTLDGAAFADPSHDRHGQHNQYGQNQTVVVRPPYGNQYGQNQTGLGPPNQYQGNQAGNPCGPGGYGKDEDRNGRSPDRGGKFRFA